MKASVVNKLYSQLKPEEQASLVFEALARMIKTMRMPLKRVSL
jgi:hypothetical protein